MVNYALELTAGEVLYSNLNYKMGTKKFYTIYKLGLSTFDNEAIFSYGIRFGSHIAQLNKHSWVADLSTNTIAYKNNWIGEMNILNKLDVQYKYSIPPNFSLMAGPSLNVYVTEKQVEGQYGTLNVPYTIYKNNWSNGQLSMWLGF